MNIDKESAIIVIKLNENGDDVEVFVNNLVRYQVYGLLELAKEIFTNQISEDYSVTSSMTDTPPSSEDDDEYDFYGDLDDLIIQ